MPTVLHVCRKLGKLTEGSFLMLANNTSREVFTVRAKMAEKGVLALTPNRISIFATTH